MLPLPSPTLGTQLYAKRRRAICIHSPMNKPTVGQPFHLHRKHTPYEPISDAPATTLLQRLSPGPRSPVARCAWYRYRAPRASLKTNSMCQRMTTSVPYTTLDASVASTGGGLAGAGALHGTGRRCDDRHKDGAGARVPGGPSGAKQRNISLRLRGSKQDLRTQTGTLGDSQGIGV